MCHTCKCIIYTHNCIFRVVCVGGDGIVHEVVNGLLEKAHRDAGIDFSVDLLPEDFAAVKLHMRVGIIPAGEKN